MKIGKFLISKAALVIVLGALIELAQFMINNHILTNYLAIETAAIGLLSVVLHQIEAQQTAKLKAQLKVAQSKIPVRK